jgi:hypothetical protein
MNISPNMDHIESLFDTFTSIFPRCGEYPSFLSRRMRDVEDPLNRFGDYRMFDTMSQRMA